MSDIKFRHHFGSTGIEYVSGDVDGIRVTFTRLPAGNLKFQPHVSDIALEDPRLPAIALAAARFHRRAIQ